MKKLFNNKKLAKLKNSIPTLNDLVSSSSSTPNSPSTENSKNTQNQSSSKNGLNSSPQNQKNQKTQQNQINVAVIGLSGREKGRNGVGKSCLCARFMYPLQDDYKKNDYRSEISYQDFSTKVISNEHFVYWGERELELKVHNPESQNTQNQEKDVKHGNFKNSTSNLNSNLSPSREKLNTNFNSNGTKNQHSTPSTPQGDPNNPLDTQKISKHSTLTSLTPNLLHHLPKKTVLRPKVRVVEHTVFLADDTNQPFRVKAKNQSYCERVTNTKLASQRKKKYVCNDNLADRITSKSTNSTSVSLVKEKSSQDQTETHDASKYMPERYNIDAFILTIDASEAVNHKNNENRRRMSAGSGNRGLDHEKESRYDAQLAFLDEVLPFLVASRKPVVVTFTQRDKTGETDADFLDFRKLIECKVLGKKITKTQKKTELTPEFTNLTPSASNGSIDFQNNTPNYNQSHFSSSQNHNSSSQHNSSTQPNATTPIKKREKPAKFNWSITPSFVDTSAELQANCDVPFISASHMVLKKSYHPTSYEEAFEKIETKRKSAKLAWKNLIQEKVANYTDYERYSTFQQQVQESVQYKTMIDIFGKNSVLLAKGFRDHVTELRQLFKETRQQGYMWYFPQALHILLPDISYIEQNTTNDDQTWEIARKSMISMAHFNEWFVMLGNGKNGQKMLWYEHPHSELIEDRRIPHTLLKSKDAKFIFTQHRKNLSRLNRKDGLEKEFRKWLQKQNQTLKIPTNHTWKSHVQGLIPGNEPFSTLNQSDLERIFDGYNQEAKDKATLDFQELFV